jgi:4-hydroxy-4-methyl-2-oxoglutarate aldolase
MSAAPAGIPDLPAVIERYRALESALFYDVLDTMGLPHQQLSLEIQPLHYEMVVAGPAFTSKMTVSEAAAKVRTERTQDPDPRFDMLEELYDGCVLVEDVGNDPVSGGLGENMGLSVQMKGCVGVICDGGTRDKKALIKAGFPVFSRFSSMTFSRDRRRHVDYQLPVRISGHLTRWVTVNPGDFVFGDSDGVLIIPRELTVEVLESAETVQRHEEHQREQLRAGVPRREVYKLDRYAHCRRLSADEIRRYTA